MIYGQWNPTSDVYVYEAVEGIVCDHCKFYEGGPSIVHATAAGMVVHLGKHLVAGHKVPASAIADLQAET